MGLPVEVNNLMLGSLGGYTVGRSLRFRSSASAYLNRTPSTTSDRRIWTASIWAKIGTLGVTRNLLSAIGVSRVTYIYMGSGNQIGVYSATSAGGGDGGEYLSTQVFRDPSAWYHIVVAYDSTQATSTNRIKVYINGVQITAWSLSTAPTLNHDTQFNWTSAPMQLSAYNASQFFDGYIAEVNFIDGQALTPSSFGAYDTNGVWQPKKYTGTYGTNGFYLPFSDNSTIEALSKDGSNTNPELITNGMFVSNVSGWTVSTGTAGSPSITWQSAHTARIANSANNGVSYYQAISTVIGQTYYVQGYVTNISIGGSTREARIIKADDTSYATNSVTIGVVQQSAGSGWIRGTFTATATTTYIFMLADILGTGTQGADFSFMSVSLGGYRNSWNPFNISLTAGTTYDSMIDSPTNAAGTSTGIGNYCVINPLDFQNANTYSNANLSVSLAATTASLAFGTMGVSSGKWYWEVKTNAGANPMLGVATQAGTLSSRYFTGSNSVYYYGNSGNKYVAGTGSAYGATYTTTDTIGIALDMDGSTITFYKNNVSQGAISLPSSLIGQVVVPAFTSGTGTAAQGMDVTFGQRPFSYTPPSGYKALNTYNLPAPSIANGAQYFAATTWTGNNASRSISNAVNGTSFQPDFLWIKDRSRIGSHDLVDSVRGVNKALISDSTSAEYTGSFVTSLDASGFTLPANTTSDNFYTNINGDSFVGWQWKGGGTAVTNNSGTISSQVSANTSAGISITTYTGTGANATVGHGLGVAPSMIIIKNRTDGTRNWQVYHASQSGSPANGSVNLNLTNAYSADSTVFNNTMPTSSVFSIGTAAAINANTQNFVAYCFAAVRGFSAFGSYTGNGSTDGPFIYTGFRPRFVLVKDSSAAQNWRLFDSSRSTYNAVLEGLFPNLSNAESTAETGPDFLSNGFKIRTSSATHNASGNTIIYAAFAENPFNYSRAR